jgi:hypothetical protein
LIKKEIYGVLHQMTLPPQSPELNPIEMVWDELVRRMKEKQSTSAQHMWELFQDYWESIPRDYLMKLVERPAVPEECVITLSAVDE